MPRKPKHVSKEDWEAVKSPPLSDAFMDKMRPAAEVLPGLADRYKRTRGKQKSPIKVSVTIRLDQDVVRHYRSGGKGWQTRLNDDLKQHVD